MVNSVDGDEESTKLADTKQCSPNANDATAKNAGVDSSPQGTPHAPGVKLEEHPPTPTDSSGGGKDGCERTTIEDSPSVAGPSDHQLHAAVYTLRQETPALGVSKILVKLKEANPTWQISEKRLRKFISQHSALSNVGQSQRGAPCEPLWIPEYDWERDYEEGRGSGLVSLGPQSSLDDTLLLECKADGCKVEPVRFDEANKGSGLIAKTKLVKGAQVFKEQAYVWAPFSKNLSRQILSGHACAYCGRIFANSRLRTPVPCPHHPAPGSKKAKAAQSVSKSTSANGEVITEKPDGPEPCYQKFCTRVCATKSTSDFGALVCTQMNPEYCQVLRQADQEDYRSPHLVFKIWAKMLIANEAGQTLEDNEGQEANGDGDLDECRLSEEKIGVNENADGEPRTNGVASTKKSKKTKGKKKTASGYVPEPTQQSQEMNLVMSRVGGLATVSDRARREQASNHLGMQLVEYRFGQIWKLAWHIIIRALHLNTGYRPKPEPGSSDEYWSRFWKRRLSSQMIAKLFGISTFLDMLGKLSLNQECDAGLYLLQSRINHSCEPNCTTVKTASNEDRLKAVPSIIYVVTTKDIEPEEELTMSYVAADMPLEPRRKKLYDEYCFSCFCMKCRRELKDAADKAAQEEGTTNKDANSAATEDPSGYREEILAHFRS